MIDTHMFYYFSTVSFIYNDFCVLMHTNEYFLFCWYISLFSKKSRSASYKNQSTIVYIIYPVPNSQSITWSDDSSDQDQNTVVNRPVSSKLHQSTNVSSQWDRLSYS